MGRLIDTDEIFRIAQWEFSEDDMFKIRWLISHIPTSYDVEAKIVELEKHRHIDRSCGDVEYSIYLDEAIEIVRGKE